MMKVLGRFKFHLYSVTLESSDDETQYEVTVRVGRLAKPTPISITVHPFDNLSAANDAFRNAVQNIMYQTSYTDVSLYMQQG